MLTHKDTKIEIDEDVSISIAAIMGYFVLQISAPSIKGTLIIDEITDREELVAMGNGIADLVEQFDLQNIDPNQKPI